MVYWVNVISCHKYFISVGLFKISKIAFTVPFLPPQKH